MKEPHIDLLDQENVMRSYVADSIKSMFPVVRARNVLDLVNVNISNELDQGDLESQKDARLRRKDWAENIVGTFELRDKKTGQLLDKDTITLGKLPKLTPRGGYIVEGNEYSILNQLRLKPGVYVYKDNTGKYTGLFNLAKGRGFLNRMRLEMNPRNKHYNLSLGTSNFDLYPILRALGVEDQAIKDSIGDEVFKANVVDDPGKEILRLYSMITEKRADDLTEAVQGIRDRLKETSLEGGTTEITLGKKFDKVDGELLLRSAKKLLDVNRGVEKEDDRNALYFKWFYGVEHNVKEMLDKAAPSIRLGIGQRVDRREKVREILANNKIGQNISKFFYSSKLKDLPPQNNPVSMLEPFTRVTLFGPGGLKSSHEVTTEMAALQPSFLGFMDPMMTPDSQEVGTRFYLSLGARKKGKDLVIPIKNLETGAIEEKTPHEMFNVMVGFPVNTESSIKTRRAAYHGEIIEVPPHQIRYEFIDSRALYNVVSNLIPFLGSTYGVRANVATKQMTQAMALKHRETPWVRAEAFQPGTSVDEGIQKLVTPEAPVAGVVSNIRNNTIYIKGKDGKSHKIQYYSDFPLNSDAYIDSTPIVHIGQKVDKGQVLADNSFTRNGALAIGTNLRVAYLPDRHGGTFEDGVVISEDASKKLTSLHMRKFSLDLNRSKGILNIGQFITFCPNSAKDINPANFTDDGLVKPGIEVKHGDILVAYAEEKDLSPTDIALGRFSGKLRNPYVDRSLVYDHPFPGKIAKVEKGATWVDVYVKTEEPAVAGDKITLRAGAKGIISKVVPNPEMPRDKEGKAVELLINPHAVPTRINPSQLLEAAAGKAAKKIGKPFIIRNFGEQSNLEAVKDFLQKSNVEEKEELFDPMTGKSLGPVFVGDSYILKLNHPVFKKFSARGYRDVPYSAVDERPSKAGGDAPQSVDALTLYSILAHGSRGFLRELANYRSQKNDEFWRAVELGTPLPPAKTPLAADKLTKLIQAAGIRVDRRNSELKLLPQSDKEVLKMSNGQIDDPSFVHAKNFQPEKGGLFDIDKTGGLLGEHWTHIKLAEPFPNPTFEQAIKVVGDISPSEFTGLLAGELKVTEDGKIAKDGRYSGGVGIKKILDSVNVTKEIENVRKELSGIISAGDAKKNISRVNSLNRKLRYLLNLKENRMAPSDVYIQQYVPIIPPRYRPLSPDHRKNSVDVNPINYLYKDLMLVNEGLKKKKEMHLTDEFYKDDRNVTYQALKAVVGLGDPVRVATQKKDIVGVMEYLSGKEGPKGGYIQERLLSKRQDLTGRSTIIPGLDIPFDHIGIPEEMMYTVYKPFIINKLIQLGYNYFDAEDQVKNRTPLTKDLIKIIADERPVAVNRHPSLHKFSVMGFKPIPIPGRAIKLHPLVIGGFNADFDGDTMGVYVPVTEEAKRDVINMLPSKNLLGTSGQLMNAPSNEAQLGLYLLTQRGDTKDLSFDSEKEAMDAYIKKKIKITDDVKIAGQKTSLGRYLINQALPEKYRNPNIVLSKGEARTLIESMIKGDPQHVPAVLDKLKDLGYRYSYTEGFTIGLSDLEVDKEKREKDIREMEDKFVSIADHGKRKEFLEKQVKDAPEKFKKDVSEKMKNNSLWMMASSGAKGKWDQMSQMVFSPVAISGPTGDLHPMLFRSNYAHGLDPSEYYAMQFAGRIGIIGKAKETSQGGAFNKEVVSTAINHVVTMEDCGTTKGVLHEVADFDNMIGRRLADHVNGVGHKNDVLTRERLAAADKIGIKQLKIRSPITCEAANGVCAFCIGNNEFNRSYRIGDNVGVIAAHATAEPLTQSILRSFHGGRGEKSGAVSEFDRITSLLYAQQDSKYASVLAEEDGKITKITPGSAGGTFIYIGDKEYFARPGQRVIVAIGQDVKKADKLTDGIAHPRDVAHLLGIHAARKSLVDQLDDIYRAGGMKVSRRHFENLAASMMNFTQVLDPKGVPGYEPGDLVSYNKLESEVKKLGLPAGQRPVHQIVIKGAPQIPTLRKDWLNQAARKEIKRALTEGAAQGWSTNLRSTNPLAAWMMGEATPEPGEHGEY